MEIAGFIVAALAFGFSVWSLYLQFFRKSEHLFLNVTWPDKAHGTGTILVVLTNGGDLSCMLCWHHFQYAIETAPGASKTWPITSKVQSENSWIQLRPADHIPFVCQPPASLSPGRLQDGQKKTECGKDVWCFPIFLTMEYVDSRGQRHLRDIKIGDQSFYEDGKTERISIVSRPIDLVQKKS